MLIRAKHPENTKLANVKRKNKGNDVSHLSFPMYVQKIQFHIKFYIQFQGWFLPPFKTPLTEPREWTTHCRLQSATFKH